MRPSTLFLAPAFAMIAIIGAARPAAASEILTVSGTESYRYDYLTQTYNYSNAGTAYTATFTYDDTTPASYSTSYSNAYYPQSLATTTSYSGGTFNVSAAEASSAGYAFSPYIGIYNNENYTYSSTDATQDSFSITLSQSKVVGASTNTQIVSLGLSNTTTAPSSSGYPANNALTTDNLAGLVPVLSAFGSSGFSLSNTSYNSGTQTTSGFLYYFQVNSLSATFVVPEPGVMVLAASGLPVALAFWLRRRRRAASKVAAA